jgi:hypothetical protein
MSAGVVANHPDIASVVAELKIYFTIPWHIH